MKTVISYGKSEDAWIGYRDLLFKLIDDLNIKNLCEIGSGANPLIKDKFIEKKSLNYSVIDISEI